jgi:glutamate synthase (NADPH/NADH) small chain
MEAEGVTFKTSKEVGVDISFKSLQENFDAVVLAGGAEDARALAIPGAEMQGVRLAMEFLTQQNKRVAGDDELRAAPRGTLTATGKHVVVLGGGDTGSDCVGTSNRQGALSVTQLEIMPKPPEKEDKALTWPDWPMKLRTSSSHQEGVERDWAVLAKRVLGDGEKVTGLECVRVEWVDRQMQEIGGSEFVIPADLILLAMGFVGPRKAGLLEQAGVALDARGNVAANTEAYATSEPNVFACGDMRRGQSLVVWAIREGRQAARAVDEALMGVSELPR